MAIGITNSLLDGMTLLITGAASGIGRATAMEAAASGVAGLMLTDVDANGLDAVCGQMGEVAVHSFVADLSDPTTPAAIYAAAKTRFPRIDGLVNSAGITTRASFLDGSADQWDRLFAINARAPFLLMQQVLPDMIAQGGGSIVNIQSMNAHCGAPELAIYSATKGALQTLTKNAANAHLADGIRVNGLNLGWTDTEAEHVMQASTLGHGGDWAQKAAAGSPLGRLLTPEEAARQVIYLLSPGSAPLTGASLDLEQWIPGAPR